MPVSFSWRLAPFARAVSAVSAAAALAACSGGQSAGPLAGASGATASHRSVVEFTMHWPSDSSQLVVRRSPKYVGATAKSVSVSVNGGPAQFLNYPATTLPIDAPDGSDTFAFATFDQPGGAGNELSSATVTQTITLGATNTVSATLAGIVKSLQVSYGNPSPNAGAAATVSVQIAALDPDGSVIVGAPDLAQPVTLSLAIPAASEAGTASLTSTTANISTPSSLAYTGGTLTSAVVTATSGTYPVATATFAPTPTFYEIPVPASDYPEDLTVGPDKNIWVNTENGANLAADVTAPTAFDNLDRLTPDGVITQFTAPIKGTQGGPIISGSDGNLYFTEGFRNKIVQVTLGGVFTEISASPSAGGPIGLYDHGNGLIYYVNAYTPSIGALNLSTLTTSSIPTTTTSPNPFARDITLASDGNLYFTEQNASALGSLHDLTAQLPEFPLSAGAGPTGIISGPDGNLWFTERTASKIGRFNPLTKAYDEFATVSPNASPNSITVAQDGSLYFSETGVGDIGRITTAGVVTELKAPIFRGPTGQNAVQGIATAPDGSIYFCQPGNVSASGNTPSYVGRLVY